MPERLIAIGDIHGCSTALKSLLVAIKPTPLDTIVTLGDYIDRGPDSKGVIEQLIDLADQCTLVPLFGNHEEMLVAAVLGGIDDMKFWLKFGGREALASWGIHDETGRVPAEHLDFIKRCKDYYETVNHIFVHAYYEPDRPLHEQNWNGLRWMNLPPIPKQHCSGKVAIVGHTPQKSGEILDLGFVKCIDTNCHRGGWLTALDVERRTAWQANQEGELRE